jgi:hypothetical protein
VRLLLLALVALTAVGATVAYAASLTVGSQRISASTRTVGHGTCTLEPVADTYTDRSRPSTSFGSATTLQVSGRTSNERYAFVRFDLLSCNAPAGATVDEATLTLTVASAPSSTRTLKLYRAGGSWGESTRWNNQPAAGASVTSSTVGPSSTTTTFQITDELEAIASGNAPLEGWQIRDSAATTSNIVASYRSEEASGAAPTLVVHYAY